jgi:hypothetical protein
MSETTPPVMEIEWLGGQCPFQAEGTINGEPFYFRSRGTHWEMSIGEIDVSGDPVWYYEEEYGEWPTAGWITADEARAFIRKAAEMFATRATTRNVDV